MAALGAAGLRAGVVTGPYGKVRTALKQPDKSAFIGVVPHIGGGGGRAYAIVLGHAFVFSLYLPRIQNYVIFFTGA